MRNKTFLLVLQQLGDMDLLSLPEGQLALNVLNQAAVDMANRHPGARLYIETKNGRPGGWDWWCDRLDIDPDVARDKVIMLINSQAMA